MEEGECGHVRYGTEEGIISSRIRMSLLSPFSSIHCLQRYGTMASAPLQQQQEIPTKAPPDEIKSADALNNLIKSLQSRTKGNSESGSSNGGDHSDNSALVSLGNTSFGFNFDSEEGCSNNSKEGQNDSNEDSDGNVKAPAVSCSSTSANKKRNNSNNPQQKQATGSSEGGGSGASDGQKSTTSSLSSSTNSKPYNTKEQNEAAANAVANLASIARSYPKNSQQTSDTAKAIGLRDALERKRKAENDKDADSGGYNTDDDEGGDGMENTSSKGGAKSRKMKREETGHKREERNQREKERSFRISKQITDLRNLLSSGGVVVPKGTKSSVLTEAANYIRMLQQHQYRSEM